MPKIKSNFTLDSIAPNFSRDSFDTLADMAVVRPHRIDKGHISYCVETDTHYVFDSDQTNPDTASEGSTGYFIPLATWLGIDKLKEQITSLENKINALHKITTTPAPETSTPETSTLTPPNTSTVTPPETSTPVH